MYYNSKFFIISSIRASIVPILLFLSKKKKNYGTRQFSIIPSPFRVKMVSRPQLKRFHSIARRKCCIFPSIFSIRVFEPNRGSENCQPRPSKKLRFDSVVPVYSKTIEKVGMIREEIDESVCKETRAYHSFERRKWWKIVIAIA